MRRFIFALFVTLAMPGAMAWADTLRVAVAAGFAPAARELAADFTDQTGVDVDISVGSSGALYAQIVVGAPFDVFVAADPSYTQQLMDIGRAAKAAPYARGALVMWTPSPVSDPLVALAEMRVIAIANPDLAPYGRAARQALQALDLWDPDRVVMGQNVGQALSLAVTGNAPGGLVAASLVPDRGVVWPVPQDLYDPVDHGIALVVSTPVSDAFWAYLQGARASDILRGAGYHVE